MDPLERSPARLHKPNDDFKVNDSDEISSLERASALLGIDTVSESPVYANGVGGMHGNTIGEESDEEGSYDGTASSLIQALQELGPGDV